MDADIAAPISLLALLFLSGIFSGSETALFSLNQGDISQLNRTPSRVHNLILRLLNQEQNLLLCILIANNVINICYFAIAAWWSHNSTVFPVLAQWFILISLAAIILFGEILPKVIASGSSLTCAKILVIPITIAMYLCTPFIAILQKVLGRFMEEGNSGKNLDVNNSELKLVIEESRNHGVVSELLHDRLLEIIDLSITPVHSVMTHRVDCANVDVNQTLDDARLALKECPGPFVIIYDQDDNEACVGLLAAQDILKGGRIFKRMRKPLFIPSGTTLPQAIELFQNQNKSAGIVVDEYGGTAGLLTLAHIGQELLGGGEHEDLPDINEPEQVDINTWKLSGQTPLAGWSSLIDEDDMENCTTIGGFLMSKLGSIPEIGDRLLYRNLLFKVESVDAHRIQMLTLQHLSPLEARRTTRNMEEL